MPTVSERDLRLAQREIVEGWGTAIARRGVVVDKERGKGIRPALEMVRRSAGDEPCAFADKVLGLAAFRLGATLGAKVMWGEMASSLAVYEGRQRGIEVRYHTLVPSIMDAKLENLCPMERLAFATPGDLGFTEHVDRIVR